MTTALGIAATVAVLKHMVEAGFDALKISDVLGNPTPTVSCLAPDLIDAQAESQLNLFVFHQSRNTGWSNQDLPSRDAAGNRTASPALALDLQLLVTAYGKENFHAETLLGAAMQVFHETPGLGRDAIRDVLAPGPNNKLPTQFALAGLADQVEQLRITPMNLTVDELMRIWAATQLPLRPSAVYQIGVLLVQAPRSTRVALPVASRNVYVQPLRQPRIDAVESSTAPGSPIFPDTTLRLRGANFSNPGAGTRVLVNGLDASAGITSITADVVQFGLLLPAPPGPPALPAGLRAGVVAVQVDQPVRMGTPPVDHGAVGSNLGVFVLNPSATFNVDAGEKATTANGVTTMSGTITVQCVPAIGPVQRVRLLLNENGAPATRPALAFSFDATPGNGVAAPATEVSFVTITYAGVPSGHYLARLQVDAGTSGLVFVNGMMAQPEVVL
jgi:hypothetical protein